MKQPRETFLHLAVGAADLYLEKGRLCETCCLCAVGIGRAVPPLRNALAPLGT
jgi:hypothetical protein